MAAGINTEISFESSTSDSATFFLTNQFASETGCVIVYTDSTYSTEVARSSNVTIYQSSTSVTVTGLAAGTTYYADFYEVNWGMCTYNGVTFSTQGSPTPPTADANTYGSVATLSKKVGQMYLPCGDEVLLDVSFNITAIGGNISRFNSQVFLRALQTLDSTTKNAIIDSIIHNRAEISFEYWDFDDEGNYWTLEIKTSSPSASYGLATGWNGQTMYETWGVYIDNPLQTVTERYPLIPTVGHKSVFATKMYGSVNGRSKLCFVGLGHRNAPPLAEIVYYPDFDPTATPITVSTDNPSDIPQLSGQNFMINFGGVDIYTSTIKEVHLYKGVSGAMGDYFLFGYDMMDTVDIGESQITSIGDYSMSGLYAIRDTNIVLPKTLTHIGSFFMNMCANFSGILDVGELPASIIDSSTDSFAVQGPNMPIYTHGLRIRGTHKNDWVAKFPYSETSMAYRQLVPADIPYGIVYYKATNSSSTVLSVELQSAAELNSLAGSSAWTATVGSSQVTVSAQGDNCVVGILVGDKITSIPSYFMSRTSYICRPIYIPPNVKTFGTYFLYYSGIASYAVVIDANITSLSNYFMYYCSSFNLYVTLPSTLTSIGNYFMSRCTAYNQSVSLPSTVKTLGTYFLAYDTTFNKMLTLPSAMTTIGGYFLRNCTAFNQNLTLPSTLTSVGTYFMNTCNAMVGTVNVGSLAETIATSNNYTFATTSSSAACYTAGITIKGSNRAAWISRFANRTSSPYRKLLNAGS